MHNTTFVPNYFFDVLLPKLSPAEMKVVLVIIRQTNGWVCKRTGGRKKSDRISYLQFVRKTGLSKRAISTTVGLLICRGLIEVKDMKGTVLTNPADRRGARTLYYSFLTRDTVTVARLNLCRKMTV